MLRAIVPIERLDPFNPAKAARLRAESEANGGRQVLCGYGCGQGWLPPWSGLVRGHYGCLVELGDDLLALMERFPQLPNERLAADIGVTTSVARKLIEAALKARSEAALRRTKAAFGDPTKQPEVEPPRRLTTRQLEVLRRILRVYAETGAIMTSRQLAEDIGYRQVDTAAEHLHSLRWKGWITKDAPLHVAACAMRCSPGRCPSFRPARRAA